MTWTTASLAMQLTNVYTGKRRTFPAAVVKLTKLITASVEPYEKTLCSIKHVVNLNFNVLQVVGQHIWAVIGYNYYTVSVYNLYHM